MGNEEEKEEKSKVVATCDTHKRLIYTTFKEPGIREIFKLTASHMFTVFMVGKGMTTFEDTASEVGDKCPYCYWDKLVVVTVYFLEDLGYPVSVDAIVEGAIEKPSPSIWKN